MKRLILTAFLGLGVAFGADDIETLTKKCEANDGRACGILADRYEKGEGVAKDANLAVKYDDKGCNLNNMPSCNNLGNIYRNGKGVAKDEAKAAEYYAKGCDLGNGSNCGNVGAYYLARTQRFLTAKKYLEKGCNLNNGIGFKPACRNVR